MRDLTEAERAWALHFAHLPLPDEAIEWEPWRQRSGGWCRFFLIREWNINEIWVSVAGEQDDRGGVTRWLEVGGQGRCTSSDRQDLIAALRDAGRLLDSLNAALVFGAPSLPA